MKKLIYIIALIGFFGFSQEPTKILSKNMPPITSSMIDESYKVTIENKGVKYLVASEIGLVKGDSLSQPPFTSQEYTDAYNNGMNLTNAIIAAFNEGFSGIILERGSYPLTGNRGSTTLAPGSNGFAMHISGIRNMDLDFNGSTLYVIYDSDNRNPYDLTTEPIYELPFKLINFRECSFITIRNLELRGDNYMRSWAHGTAEDGDIGCYGITLSVNSQNFKIENYVGHGFRCESLAVGFKGYSDLKLDVWDYGGIDDSGVDQAETGAFRTPLRDITTMTVVDNSVSIVGWGFTREIKFRNSRVKIFYYDNVGAFIYSEHTIQNKLNYLPEGTRYCRIVAYDDERTVSEGETHYNYCALTSGTPRNLEVVNCKFYNNMRGGIAGAANNTIIRHCVFHTIGDEINAKYGWGVYGDTTKFAIDIEDGMPDFVMVENNRFENCGHAMLTPACQTLIFKNNLCQDIYYNLSVLNCKYADVSGNIFNGGSAIGGGLEVTSNLAFSERTTFVTNNQFKDNMFYAVATNNDKNTIMVSNNKYLNSEIKLTGNVFSGLNYHYDYVTAFQTPIEVTDVLQFDDYIKEKVGLTSWENIKIETKNKDSRAIFNINTTSNVRMPFADCLNVPSMHFISDTAYAGINFRWDASNTLTQNVNKAKFENLLITLGDAVSVATLPDLTINYNGVEFINSQFAMSRRVSSDAGDMVINFNDCKFDVTDLVDLRILNNNYANTGGTLTMNFNNCHFTSNTSKTIAITTGTAIVGLTSDLIGCTFNNVTITGNTQPIKTKVASPNAPSYADNATALAALGEGWIYKNTTSGEFDTTHL